MPFWTAVDGISLDPKRVSRFKVEIESLNDPKGGSTVWFAKSFSKPTAEIKTTTHRYLNHQFNYPGSVSWGDVSIELIDPADPIDAAGSLAQLLAAMGYEIPKDGLSLVNISKRKAVSSLGDISVSELDDEGQEIETWTLQQAFVTKFEWGSLKYDGDDLNVLKLTIKYDWATCEIQRNTPSAITAVEPSDAISTSGMAAKSFFSKPSS